MYRHATCSMVPQALLSGSCMLGEMKVMYRLATCSTVPHALPSRHSPWRRRWRRRKRASDATSTSESCTNPCRPPYPVLIHRSRPFQSVCCSTYQSPTGACKWFPKVLRFRRPRMLAFYCTWCRRGTRCLAFCRCCTNLQGEAAAAAAGEVEAAAAATSCHCHPCTTPSNQYAYRSSRSWWNKRSTRPPRRSGARRI